MISHADMQTLISELIEANREYSRLAFDEDELPTLGNPCNPQQIAQLQRILGKPLPPSYRTFLELHNGWDGFDGFEVDKILAVEDYSLDWVKNRIKALGELFDEFASEDPYKAGAIPIVLGEDERTFLVVDPRTARSDGEMDFISFDLTEEQKRFTDFSSFLQNKIKVMQRLIEREKKGIN